MPICRAAAAIRSAGSTTSRRGARAGAEQHDVREQFRRVINRYQGVDFSANVRLRRRHVHQHRRQHAAAAARQLRVRPTEIDSPEAQFCRTVTPYRPGLQDFRLAHAAVGVAGRAASSSSVPGPQITATWNAPNSRDRAGARPQSRRPAPPPTKSIQLIEPGTLYGENHTQLDRQALEAVHARPLPPARRRRALQRVQQRLRQLGQHDVLDDGQQRVPAADRCAAGPAVQDRGYSWSTDGARQFTNSQFTNATALVNFQFVNSRAVHSRTRSTSSPERGSCSATGRYRESRAASRASWDSGARCSSPIPDSRRPDMSRARPRSLRDAGIAVTRFHDFDANPDSRHGRSRPPRGGMQRGVDSIVALGGGSSLDCAKGINFVLTNGGSMRDYRGSARRRGRCCRRSAIPTTAGTGSEAQSYAIISDADTHAKMACGDPKSGVPRRDSRSGADGVAAAASHRRRRLRCAVARGRGVCDDEADADFGSVRARGVAAAGGELRAGAGGAGRSSRRGGRCCSARTRPASPSSSRCSARRTPARTL